MNWWDYIDWGDPVNRDCSLNQGMVGWVRGCSSCYGGAAVYDIFRAEKFTFASGGGWLFSNGMPMFHRAHSVANAIPQVSAGPFTAVFYGSLGTIATNNYLALVSRSVYTSESSNSGWSLGISGQFGTSDFGPSANISNNNSYASYAFPASNTSWASGPLFTAMAYTGSTRYLWRSQSIYGSLVQTSGSATMAEAANPIIEIANAPFAGGPAYCSDALIYNRVLTELEVNQIRYQALSGFPDQLNHLDSSPRYAEVAVSGGATPWIYARRQPQIIGGGMGL